MVCWAELSLYSLHRGQCAHSSPKPHLVTLIMIPGWYKLIQRYSALLPEDRGHKQSPTFKTTTRMGHTWRTYLWKVPVLMPGLCRCSIKFVNRISFPEGKGNWISTFQQFRNLKVTDTQLAFLSTRPHLPNKTLCDNAGHRAVPCNVFIHPCFLKGFLKFFFREKLSDGNIFLGF